MLENLVYLHNTGIVKLQSAARAAGMRWKSGAPGYDKAGIISRLEAHPSILRACVALLKREENTPQHAPAPATSLLDDLRDDMPDAPVPAPVSAPIDNGHTQVLAEGIKAMYEDLQQFKANTSDKHGSMDYEIAKLDKRLDKLADVCAKLADKPKPIIINIPDFKPIYIDPDTCHASYSKLLVYLQVNRRVILEGPAGTGKSIAVKNAAATLGLDFHVVPPVTQSHELIGHLDAHGVFHDTPLTLAYKNGGLCLLDEADASLPDALLVANPILDGNGFATLGDGKQYAQHKDFIAVFNMNTSGNGATMQYAGRNRLDGATLARFGVRIKWEIDPRIEESMANGQTQWLAVIQVIRAFMEGHDIVDVNATPRHLKAGAQLLNAGVARVDVLQDCLKNGALESQWQDVTRLPAVAAFLKG